MPNNGPLRPIIDIFNLINNRRSSEKGSGAVWGRFIPVDLSNPTAMFNKLRRKNGAYLGNAFGSDTSVTLGGAHTKKVNSVSTLSSIVSGIATDNEAYPSFDSYIIDGFLKSVMPFSVVPFVCTLENGESLASSTDYNGDSVTAAIAAAISAGDRTIVLGPEYIGNFRGGSTSDYMYEARITFDASSIMNEYSKYYANAELEEKNPLPMYFGIAMTGQPSQVLKWNLHTVWTYSLRPRSSVLGV